MEIECSSLPFKQVILIFRHQGLFNLLCIVGHLIALSVGKKMSDIDFYEKKITKTNSIRQYLINFFLSDLV